MNLETLQVFTRWFERTEYLLKLERTKLGVRKSGALDESQESDVRQASNSLLVGELSFLVRGRFVDMGAGKKARKLESRETNGQLIDGKSPKPRKPKKWFSRTFYGRLNDLQGVLGYKLMQSAIDAVKDPLESRSTGNVGRPRL